MITSIKTCFKCQEDKPLSDFYKHPSMSDGHLNKCKYCTKADVRLHRRSIEYRESVLSYDRRRGNRQSSDYRVKHRSENEAVYKATNAVYNAVRDGFLKPPSRCELCGVDSKLHGHHFDYEKPLVVVWLCAACHRQAHAIIDLCERANNEYELSIKQYQECRN